MTIVTTGKHVIGRTESDFGKTFAIRVMFEGGRSDRNLCDLRIPGTYEQYNGVE